MPLTSACWTISPPLLRQGALPGELDDFSDEDCHAAAAFIAGCASRRPPGIALVRLESAGTKLGQRRMRICIANDDMPFLVDSIAGAIAGARPDHPPPAPPGDLRRAATRRAA